MPRSGYRRNKKGKRYFSATPRVSVKTLWKNFWLRLRITGSTTPSSGTLSNQLVLGQSDMRQASPANPPREDIAMLRRFILKGQHIPQLFAATEGMIEVNTWLVKTTAPVATYMITNNLAPDSTLWPTDDNVHDARVLWHWSRVLELVTSANAQGDFIKGDPAYFAKDFRNVNWRFRGADQLYLFWRGNLLAGATVNANTLLTTLNYGAYLSCR